MEGIGQNKDSGTSKTAVGALTETQEAGGKLSCVGTDTDQLDHTLSTTPERKPKESPSPFPNQMTQQSPHTSVLPEAQSFQGPGPNPYLSKESPTHHSKFHLTQSPQTTQVDPTKPNEFQTTQTGTSNLIPKSKWKKLARTNPRTQYPIAHHYPKRKSDNLNTHDSDSEQSSPKQCRLNGLDGDEIFSSAEVARQPRCPQ